MTDREYAYIVSRTLENKIAFAENNDQNTLLVTLDVLKDILTLLKGQEAVEARKKNDGKPQPWTSWWYVCGDCGQEIEYHDRFCRWCGRSVKWE